jgi:hypothetical protein
MPRPKGWTESMVRKRDEIVEAILREGVPPGRTPEERRRPPRARAYAIATAQIQRRRRQRA